MAQPLSGDIGKVIQRVLMSEIESIIAEESKLAADRVQSRVRGKAGDIAARVLQRFSMERFGETLRIEVDLRGGE